MGGGLLVWWAVGSLPDLGMGRLMRPAIIYISDSLPIAGYAALLAVSLIARVPGLGLVVEFIRSLPTEHFKAWSMTGWTTRP